MSRQQRRIRNTNDVAAITDENEITVNVAVLAASANPDRMYFAITTLVRGAFVRFIPTATDNAIRKGIPLVAGLTYEMPTDNIYTGEISIINKKNNEKPIFYVTEY